MKEVYRKSFAPICMTVLIALAGCSSDNKSVAENPIAIEEARNSSTGDTVFIEGAVTVSSNLFTSSIPGGFALQDLSGGIYIVDTTQLGYYSIGETIRVRGILYQLHKLTSLQLIQSELTQIDFTVTPDTIKTGDIGEYTEGRLVTSTGVITALEDDSPYGFKVFINDGTGDLLVFINHSTDIETDFEIGSSITVTGLSSQYENNYEICPRKAEDIIMK